MESLSIENIIRWISLDGSFDASFLGSSRSNYGSEGDFLTVLQRGKPQIWIREISTDSRSIQSSDLFLALVGEYFDGHDFLASVLEKGVQVLVVQKDRWDRFENLLNQPVWILGVESSLEAYQRLAQGSLRQYSPKKVAITGSNGKTSLKEMMRSILATEWKVHASRGNFNNQVGVPKTLLELDKSHQILLVEMGAGKKGDIGKLSKILEPDFGIITNISQAHGQFLGSLTDIAHEKRDLFLGFQSSSLALLNREDPWYDFLIQGLKQIYSFASSFASSLGSSLQSSGMQFVKQPIKSLKGSKHSVFHSPISIEEDLGLNGYRLRVGGSLCFFSLCGLHQVLNLQFAWLLAKVLDLPHRRLIEGIESIRPNSMRMQVEKGKYILILDAYNANPESMKQGLDYFRALKISEVPMRSKPKKIALLGDMLELGDDSKSLHLDLGKYIAELELDFLFLLGEYSENIQEGAIQKGFPESRVFYSKEPEILIQSMKQTLEQGDLVYCKASRGVELERVYSSFL